MIQTAAMLEAGIIECGLIVSGEVAEPLYNATIRSILSDKNLTRKSFKSHFASLTIGSGACGIVMTKHDQTSHRLIGAPMPPIQRPTASATKVLNRRVQEGRPWLPTVKPCSTPVVI